MLRNLVVRRFLNSVIKIILQIFLVVILWQLYYPLPVLSAQTNQKA